MEETQARTKVLKNGAIYDMDKKQIVKAPVMSSEVASALARKRWDQVRRKAAQRILKEAQSIESDIETPADALAFLHTSTYTKLLDYDKPNLDQVIKLTQFVTGMADVSQRENAATPGTISADPDTLLRLAAAIEEYKTDAVDKARAVDAKLVP